MKTLFCNVLKSSFLAAGIAFTACSVTLPAQAFTLGFNGYFGSTNDPATGASATVDFTFTDLVGGGIQMKMLLTNTTGNTNMTEGLTTSGAIDSEFLSVGFDWANGDLASLLKIKSYTLGKPAFDELVYKDTTLTGGTSSSTTIDGDGWGSVSLNNVVFDIGLVTSKNLLSTGSPKDGLNAGQTETVIFNLAPTGFANAMALEQWFVNGFVEGGYLTTAARFKAVDGTNISGGSDKLIGGNLQEYFNYTSGLRTSTSSPTNTEPSPSSPEPSPSSPEPSPSSPEPSPSSPEPSPSSPEPSPSSPEPSPSSPEPSPSSPEPSPSSPEPSPSSPEPSSSSGDDDVIVINPSTTVPEPGTLLGLAAFSVGGLSLRRKKSS